MKRRDVKLIVILVLIALMIAFFLRKGEPGDYFTVTIEGKVHGQYLLSKEQSIEINTSYGCNCIIVEKGMVKMASADCPDKYCMQQHAISKQGETIVCLPHRLVIEVRRADSSEMDAIVQ